MQHGVSMGAEQRGGGVMSERSGWEEMTRVVHKVGVITRLNMIKRDYIECF
jgi:hypothetical protein